MADSKSMRRDKGVPDEVDATKRSLDRRSFLKAAAGVAATATVLSGCSQPQAQSGSAASSTEASASASDAEVSASSASAESSAVPQEAMQFNVGPAQPDYDEIKRCTCAPNCVGSCGINAYVKDDTIVKVEPADFPDTQFNRICLCGIANAMQRVYSPDRVKYPMKRAGERGEGKWDRISWEEAIDLIHEKMQANIDEFGPTSNSWITMVGNYSITAQLNAAMMSSTYEGTQWTNFGIMGDLGCNMGWVPTMGIQQDSADWSDMVGSKSIIMFGCNYAETNKQEMHFVFDAQEAGSKLIVIDPRMSRTAAKADWWIPIRPGTDAALMMGMMNYIIENDHIDADYIRTFTNGAFLVDTATRKLIMDGDNYLVWDEKENKAVLVAPLADELKPHYPSVIVEGEVPEECNVPKTAAITGSFKVTVGGTEYDAVPAFQRIVDSVKDYTPEKASEICEVPADDIVKLARIYCEETPAKIQISQGTNRYWNGHLPTRAAIQMAAITGNVGKDHANVNWAGGGLMRILFSVNPEGMLPYPDHMMTQLPGTQLMDLIAKQEPHPVKMIWFNNYGWGTQMPFAGDKMANDVLPQLNFIITSDQIMNAGAEMSDLVLPICSYYEEPCEVITAWSNLYLQLRKQVISPLYEAKTDYQIGQMLAEKFGIKEDSAWKYDIEEWLRKFVIEGNLAPEFRVDWDELYEKQVVRANFEDPWIPFKSGRWQTPSGKLEIYTDFLTDFNEEIATHYEPIEGHRSELAQKYPLTFMNARTVFTTHSQHVNLPWIREVVPDPWIEISAADAKERGIESGDTVRVFNDRGEYKVKALVTEEIKPGCVNQRQGWWPKDFVEGHYRELLHMELNPAEDVIFETNFAPYDNLVQIEKA